MDDTVDNKKEEICFGNNPEKELAELKNRLVEEYFKDREIDRERTHESFKDKQLKDTVKLEATKMASAAIIPLIKMFIEHLHEIKDKKSEPTKNPEDKTDKP